MKPRDFRLITALVVLLAAGGLVATRVTAFRKSLDTTSSTEARKLNRHDPAPEFKGISTWINSEPLTIGALRGKVVLIDFWTYSCVNCIRTIPELKALYAAYHDKGLEIVGVHSPEFSFEKDPANVRRAVYEHQVPWPVAMDNDLDTWGAYDNQYWPHVYVIDSDGQIRFDHIGEGGAPDIENAVRTLLGTTVGAALPTYQVPESITPEIYLGYDRGEPAGFLGNAEGYTHDRRHDYRLPRTPAIELAGTEGKFFLGGGWLAAGESVVSAAPGSKLVVHFTAQNVFIVAGAAHRSTISIDLDGAKLEAARSARAVTNGVLPVAMRDLYPIVHLPGVETHTLTLTFNDTDIDAYTFTFG